MNNCLNFTDTLYQELQSLFGTQVDKPTGTDTDILKKLQLESFDRNSSALCLSGGGIRSAAFCLGVLNGLARVGCLAKFHYLSTVSGGGYTGSMINAWAYRANKGMGDVQEGLSENANVLKKLREYTSYLSPDSRITSPDGWVLVATYIRNLLLNWLILLPLLAAIAAAPFVIQGLFLAWPTEMFPGGALDTSSVVALYYGGLLLTAWATYKLRRHTSLSAHDGGESELSEAITILSAMALGSLAISFGWFAHGLYPAATWDAAFGLEWSFFSKSALICGYLVFSLVTSIQFCIDARNPQLPNLADVERQRPKWGRIGLAFISTGLLTGMLILLWEKLFTADRIDAQPQLFIVSGPGSLLLVFITAEVLFQGLASKLITDYDREWWARACAWMFMFATAWTIWIGVSLFGPIKIKETIGKIDWLLGISWPAMIGLGGYLARRAFISNTADPGNSRATPRVSQKTREIAYNLSAAIFILVLFCGLASLIHWILPDLPKLNATILSAEPHRSEVIVYLEASVGILMGLLLTSTFFAVVVNINRFSLHGMYRERLIRAFLGVSRNDYLKPPPDKLDNKHEEKRQFSGRKENSFTHFDADDNPIFWWLDPTRDTEGNGRARGTRETRTPLHIVNCALNMVGDRRPFYRQRKAAAFTISALHSGSEETGYRSSKEYCKDVGGITLGTAMAVSGAAVSPNAGYYSKPLLTFLLTLFNARLGSWLGNPGNEKTSEKPGPTLALVPMIRELMGLTTAAKDWIYLSDGGHFDNLGIYEMIHRGCRYIVVIDASADPKRNCDDLGNAIEHVREDFGVSIERTGKWRIGQPGEGPKGRYCALFDIDYKHGEPGKLLYVKPAYYTDEDSKVPLDVMRYAGRERDFPNESTVNQFFTETQFESYRALGQHEIDTIIGTATGSIEVADLINAAKVYIV